VILVVCEGTLLVYSPNLPKDIVLTGVEDNLLVISELSSNGLPESLEVVRGRNDTARAGK
jgi:hypothetical protein